METADRTFQTDLWQQWNYFIYTGDDRLDLCVA